MDLMWIRAVLGLEMNELKELVQNTGFDDRSKVILRNLAGIISFLIF